MKLNLVIIFVSFILINNKTNATNETECPESSRAVDEFPTDYLTKEQRLRGFFLIHIFLAIYFFIFLALICDKYFIPSVERICQILNISQDVAASTFMATATTIPEFFSNTISTFFADSDMGLNAIIGSTLFNTLGVAASASLFVPRPVQIDYWPITRDSMLFSLNIIALLIISWDGYVTWWETGILVFLYIFYWIIMFQNKRIVKIVKYYIEEKLMWCQRIKNYDIANQRPKIIVESKQVEPVKTTQYGTIVESYKQIDVENYKTQDFVSRTDLLSVLTEHDKDDDAKSNLFHYPSEKSGISQFWFILTWPMRIILKYTIPDPVRHKNLFMLSFVMCIIWIGCVTFMVFWMTVLVGDTFNIPDNVMGLTFLGFGGCMPEAISAVIVARRGSGQMGVSNALGANSLAILFSLGVPWFLKTILNGAWTVDSKIRVFTDGTQYTIIALILAVAILYLSVSIAGYQLRRDLGFVLIVAYSIFATFGILVESGVILKDKEAC